MNKSNLSPIITGIILLIITILIVGIYNVKYKTLNLKTKEGFQSQNDSVLDINDLDIDNDVFKLISTNQNEYVHRINEINSEMVNYENNRNKEVLSHSIFDNKFIDNLLKKHNETETLKRQNMLSKEPNIIKSVKGTNNQILLTLPIDLDNYQIQINDKCLTVRDDNKYMLDTCNVGNMSSSQKFYTKRIYNSANAKTVTGKDVNNLSDYPYNIFKSRVTDHCLALDNDGVSVTKCNPNDVRQKFKISGEPNLCPLV